MQYIIFAVLNNIAQLKFEFQKKKLIFLKIHNKDSLSILFSPIIDGKICIKVRSYVTFKNICQSES